MIVQVPLKQSGSICVNEPHELGTHESITSNQMECFSLNRNSYILPLDLRKARGSGVCALNFNAESYGSYMLTRLTIIRLLFEWTSGLYSGNIYISFPVQRWHDILSHHITTLRHWGMPWVRINPVQHNKYHGRWCPGSLRRQHLSTHDIASVE